MLFRISSSSSSKIDDHYSNKQIFDRRRSDDLNKDQTVIKVEKLSVIYKDFGEMLEKKLKYFTQINNNH